MKGEACYWVVELLEYPGEGYVERRFQLLPNAGVFRTVAPIEALPGTDITWIVYAATATARTPAASAAYTVPNPGDACYRGANVSATLGTPSDFSATGSTGEVILSWEDNAADEWCYGLSTTTREPSGAVDTRWSSLSRDATSKSVPLTGLSPGTTLDWELYAATDVARSPVLLLSYTVPGLITPTPAPLCGEEAEEDTELAAPTGVAAGWNGDSIDLTWDDTTDEVCYLLVIVEHGPSLDEVDRRVESPDADTNSFMEHRSEYDDSGATQVEFSLAAVYGDRRSAFVTADLSIPPLEPQTPTPSPTSEPSSTPRPSASSTPTPALLPDTGDPAPERLPLVVVAGLGGLLLLGGAGVAARVRR